MTNLFPRVDELFPGSGIVRKYSFEAIFLRDNSALLARAEHQLAMNFAINKGVVCPFSEKDCFDAGSSMS